MKELSSRPQPKAKGVWECSAAASKIARRMLDAWDADALIMISLAETEFCVETKAGRFVLGAAERGDIQIGVQELLDAKLTAHAATFTLSYLKSKAALSQKKIKPLTRRLKLQVFIAGMMPFLGFGLTDNGLMVIFGELIDEFLGTRFKLSAMGAAAWGNLLSDVAGVFLGGSVQQVANLLGAAEPALTHAQRNLPSTIQCRLLGEAVGVGLGCWAGMAPLLLYPERFSKADAQDAPAVAPEGTHSQAPAASGEATFSAVAEGGEGAPPLRNDGSAAVCDLE